MTDKMTDLRIQMIGKYSVPIADPADCTVCHDADYGDVLINGVCGRCLMAENERIKYAIAESTHTCLGFSDICANECPLFEWCPKAKKGGE